MALMTPEDFLQSVLNEKGSNENDSFLLASLTPWIEDYGEDGFDEFIESLENDIAVIQNLQQRFLREREEG